VHGGRPHRCRRDALRKSRICDVAKAFPPGLWRDALSAHLRPHPVAVLSAEIVPETFEARFPRSKRHYLYRIAKTSRDHHASPMSLAARR